MHAPARAHAAAWSRFKLLVLQPTATPGTARLQKFCFAIPAPRALGGM